MSIDDQKTVVDARNTRRGSISPNPFTPRTATVSNNHAEGIAMADTNMIPVFTATLAFTITGVLGVLAFA